MRCLQNLALGTTKVNALIFQTSTLATQLSALTAQSGTLAAQLSRLSVYFSTRKTGFSAQRNDLDEAENEVAGFGDTCRFARTRRHVKNKKFPKEVDQVEAESRGIALKMK
jgi:hypothetical protein